MTEDIDDFMITRTVLLSLGKSDKLCTMTTNIVWMPPNSPPAPHLVALRSVSPDCPVRGDCSLGRRDRDHRRQATKEQCKCVLIRVEEEWA